MHALRRNNSRNNTKMALICKCLLALLLISKSSCWLDINAEQETRFISDKNDSIKLKQQTNGQLQNENVCCAESKANDSVSGDVQNVFVPTHVQNVLSPNVGSTTTATTTTTMQAKQQRQRRMINDDNNNTKQRRASQTTGATKLLHSTSVIGDLRNESAATSGGGGDGKVAWKAKRKSRRDLDDVALKCRVESDSYLEFEAYKHYTCANCYNQVPREYFKNKLTTFKRDDELVALFDRETSEIVATNETARIRDTFKSVEKFEKWSNCCRQAVECCKENARHLSATHDPLVAGALVDDPKRDRCPGTWDGLSCWAPAVVGQLAWRECPREAYLLDFEPACRGYVTKQCFQNASWFINRMGHEWSDYSACSPEKLYKARMVHAAVAYICEALIVIPALLILGKFPNRGGNKRIRIMKSLLFYILMNSLIQALQRGFLATGFFAEYRGGPARSSAVNSTPSHGHHHHQEQQQQQAATTAASLTLHTATTTNLDALASELLKSSSAKTTTTTTATNWSVHDTSTTSSVVFMKGHPRQRRSHHARRRRLHSASHYKQAFGGERRQWQDNENDDDNEHLIARLFLTPPKSTVKLIDLSAAYRHLDKFDNSINDAQVSSRRRQPRHLPPNTLTFLKRHRRATEAATQPDGSNKRRESAWKACFCWLLQMASRLVRLMSYAWMFTGGVYLCSALHFAPAEPPAKFIKIVFFLTNAFPSLIFLAYVIARTLNEPSPLNIILKVCWFEESKSEKIEDIADLPNLILVCSNVILFVITLIILARINRPGSTRPDMSSFAYFKAAGTLLFLYGGHYFFLAYRPESESCSVDTMMFYAFICIDVVQGIAISIVFCYMTQEGKVVVAKYWRQRNRYTPLKQLNWFQNCLSRDKNNNKPFINNADYYHQHRNTRLNQYSTRSNNSACNGCNDNVTELVNINDTQVSGLF